MQKNFYFNKYRYLIIINFKFLFISRVKYLKQWEKSRSPISQKKEKKNIGQGNGIFWWRAMACRRETSRYRAERAWIVAFVIDTWTHQCFHCNFLLLLWSTRFQVTVDSCFELWHRSSHTSKNTISQRGRNNASRSIDFRQPRRSLSEIRRLSITSERKKKKKETLITLMLCFSKITKKFTKKSPIISTRYHELKIISREIDSLMYRILSKV